MLLEILEVHFDCAGSQNLFGRGGCFLSLWWRAHFRTWWSLFVAGAKEGPKSTFRDRCKGSERFYFELQTSWQAQRFGHDGDLRRAPIS